MKCDVLVVGAGPAGSSAAAAAAEAGADVLVVERRSTVGQPVMCAEFIPRPLLREAGLDRTPVVQEIRAMEVFMPGGGTHSSNSPGFMLERAVFDRLLAVRAVSRGAQLMTGARFMGFEGSVAGGVDGGGAKDGVGGGKCTVLVGGETAEVKARVIIGADGPKSAVGKGVGAENARFLLAAQAEVPLREPLDATRFYFDKDFAGGYGYLFPKGDTANVGVGVHYGGGGVGGGEGEGDGPGGVPARRLLGAFIEHLVGDGLIHVAILTKTGGLIPVGGPLPAVHGNVMLVGDAAGQTHPITGGGIPQAVICGKMAGEAAARAVNEDSLDALAGYEAGWRAVFGGELERAVGRRELMESRWDDLEGIIRQCWVSFKEYYR